MAVCDVRPVGEQIRERREELGLTQSKFGRLVGVEGGTVNGWENRGVKPELDTLIALVFLAGMDPVSLLGEPGVVDLVAVGLAAA